MPTSHDYYKHEKSMHDSSIPWPAAKDERWKWTPVKNFFRQEYFPIEEGAHPLNYEWPEDVKSLVNKDEGCVVFYNGRLIENLCSWPDGVNLNKKESAPSEADWLEPFYYFNRKMNSYTFEIHFARAHATQNLDAPKLHIIHLYGNLFNAPTRAFVVYDRMRVSLAPGAKVQVFEHRLAANNIAFHVNSLCEWSLAEGTQAEVLHQQWLGDYSVAVIQHRYDLKKDAQLKLLTMSTGSQLLRNDLKVKLCGEGASAHLNGLALLDESKHLENSTHVQHQVGYTKSVQVYKGLLAGQCKNIFSGRLNIDLDAQKSDAHQLSQTLLLSEKAQISTVPQLEVNADDVKATHGATVGQLQKEDIFYLQCRALSEVEAKVMLAKAFAYETVLSLESKAITQKAEALINKKLRTLILSDKGNDL